MVIQTPHSDAANCTVKNRPACVSFSDHREINSGNIGPTMTVGIPVNTNPAESNGSRILLVLARAGTGMVAAMDASHSEGAGSSRQLSFIKKYMKAVTLPAEFGYAFVRRNESGFSRITLS